MTVISAVIVTYEPDRNSVLKLVSSLNEQVSNIYIIDNSLSESIDCSGFHKAKQIRLGENKGIAYAQNIGFVEAIKSDSDFVITFDQDSIVEVDFVSNLLEEFHHAYSINPQVVCIGPTTVNARNGAVYEKRFKNSIDLGRGLYSVKSVMSSGSLYPINSFAKVGFNKAEWFIDGIEIEWCYRAIYKGYNVVMTKNVKMNHNLGDFDHTFLGLVSMVTGSPFRLYYIFRNWIHLLREPSCPLSAKLRLILEMPIKFIVFSTIPPRKERILFMIKGVFDGVLNKVNQIK